MMNDIEMWTRRVTQSLAIPIGMIHDESTVQAPSFAAMGDSDVEVKRARRQVNAYLDDLMLRILGRPPQSAVDRLADLLDEEDDGA